MTVRPKDIIHHNPAWLIACLIGILLFSSYDLSAFQNTKIDSLKAVLNQEISDQDRVDTYNSLAFQTYRIEPNTAKQYARLAMRLSSVANYQEGTANSHNSFGFIAFTTGEYDSARWHYDQFLAISKSTKDSVSMANALNNLGILYRNQGKYNEALSYYEQSLAIRKSIGSKTGLGPMYNNLGLLHTNLGNYQEGMDYYLKAIAAKRKPDRITGRAMAYINLANLKELLDDYEGSQEAFEKAYTIYQEYNDRKGMAISFHNIAQTYSKQGDIPKALNYYLKSSQINRQLNNRKQQAENLNAIAELKYSLQEWDSCAYYLKETQIIANQVKAPHVLAELQMSLGKFHLATGKQQQALTALTNAHNSFVSLRTKKEIAESALLLSQVYNELNINKKAYDYLNVHVIYSDSLMNENKVSEIAKIEFQYDLSKVEGEKQLLLEAQEELGSTLSASQRQLANQRQTIIWGGFILGLVVISVIFISHFYQQARKTRNSLKEANLQISRFNQSLEQKINERTEKIEKQNQQLMDYAFAISHEIRSPLTNLIGFLDLDDHDETNNFSDEEKRQIKSSMVNSIQKIDEATRRAAKIGNAEDLKSSQRSQN